MMSTTILALSFALACASCSVSSGDEQPTPTRAPAPQLPKETGLYSLNAPDIDGHAVSLAKFAGKVVLIVNTASECGYTPQYAGLQKMYDELSARGFVVLGYPSNDFGGQEPGDETTIKAFCTENYRVTFPMFGKVVTQAGPDQAPVYAFLSAATGKLPNWNFCKYLVGKDGRVIGFYPSKVTPNNAELRQAIEAALAAG